MENTLKNRIRALLDSYDHRVGFLWSNYAPSNMPGDTPEIEILRLNSYLRTELGLLPYDTISARECLEDYIPERVWFKNFQRYVAPVIIQYGLPSWGHL